MSSATSEVKAWGRGNSARRMLSFDFPFYAGKYSTGFLCPDALGCQHSAQSGIVAPIRRGGGPGGQPRRVVSRSGIDELLFSLSNRIARFGGAISARPHVP